ncbi:MAG: hypothetical protein AAFU53_07470 [Cyanobacteria bacterium J06632_3]
MPQPCSQPLKSNPFESYRDPITGQWKVRYPASNLPTTTQPSPIVTAEADIIKRVTKRRHWKQSAETQVA